MSHSPPLVETKLSGVVLVCGDCEGRGDGPAKLRAKGVRKALKRDVAHLPGRMRVVQSSCLGLCPKKAMALMAMAAGQPPLAAEACRDDDVADFAGALSRALR